MYINYVRTNQKTVVLELFNLLSDQSDIVIKCEEKIRPYDVQQEFARVWSPDKVICLKCGKNLDSGKTCTKPDCVAHIEKINLTCRTCDSHDYTMRDEYRCNYQTQFVCACGAILGLRQVGEYQKVGRVRVPTYLENFFVPTRLEYHRIEHNVNFYCVNRDKVITLIFPGLRPSNEQDL